MTSSCLSAFLVIAGLIYATGAGQRNQAGLAAAGCEPGLSPPGVPCTTQQMLIAQYMAILTPASRQLNDDRAAYTACERHQLLAAAETALTAEAATENTFQANLAGIEFPPAIQPVARSLARADQALENLTAEQARSSSLTQLKSFDRPVQSASAAVRTEMTRILNALHSPLQEN